MTANQSWTLDPALTSCGWCANWQIACATVAEKEAAEERHRAKFHAGAPVDVSDVRDRMLGERPDDAAAVADAIFRAARDNGGRVDANLARPYMPAGTLPQMVGGTFGRLVQQRRLRQVDWTANKDKHGRNDGKPLPVYEVCDVGGAA